MKVHKDKLGYIYILSDQGPYIPTADSPFYVFWFVTKSLA